MATINTQQIGIAGIAPAYSAASVGGDEFVPDPRTFLYVKNSDSSAHTVTVVTPGTAFGQAIADDAVVIPAGAERVFGGFDPAGFQGSDSLAQINYSAVTGITVAVLRN